MKVVILMMVVGVAVCMPQDKITMAKDYFSYKNVSYICYFTCEQQFYNLEVAKELFVIQSRISVIHLEKNDDFLILEVLHQWKSSIGVLLDGTCDSATSVLEKASEATLFDAMHVWFILAPVGYNSSDYIKDVFGKLNLSIDADIAVVSSTGTEYKITDVFNFGKIQGNGLEITSLGSWRPDKGLEINLRGFKYYHRWNFHNLTLRAISVMANRPDKFEPALLSDIGYSPGIVSLTKITNQLLNLLKEQHNFRFNYTIADRWIGDPKPNSTLAVTNSLLWGQQDISSTSARIFPLWLEMVDICFPPTYKLETKFYYLMLEGGIGQYENRFLTPMSPMAWWSTLAACTLCTAVLAATAWFESRRQPAVYAVFSVSAALFQQDFEDGDQTERLSSQGRKVTLFVVGMTSMLLYNYYTSSVVSWLLNADAPSLTSLNQLIDSELELVFEDIGYTRSWLQSPGFFYYSGYVNPIEDRMREVKVTKAKRTVDIFQPVKTGIQLIRTGSYAYHTEPYTASQEIAPTFSDAELCSLGSMLVMPPAHVYIMVQKRSPFKEFFVWSMMRLSERGHLQATRRRFAGTMPACSGRRPRALALGQAAPAFLILLQLTVLAVLILVAERVWYRFRLHQLEFQL